MKSLYLRVWLTVVVALALFALGTGWLAERQVTQERMRLGEERARMVAQAADRVRALGELLGQALPDASAPVEEQAEVLLQWSERLRLPVALDDAQGRRLAASPAFERRLAEGQGPPPVALNLEDGRTLWLMRGLRPAGPPRDRRPDGAAAPTVGPTWPSGGGWVLLLGALFVAVAAGAYPVVRRLTRRLESLQRGVEQFGAGALGHRVDESGRDEVAQLAAAFNRTAARIESLVQSHGRLVAHASHELRSPLARLKVALGLLEGISDSAARQRLRREIDDNLRELDALIEEMLLSSRLQAQQGGAPMSSPLQDVDPLALVAEEAARAGAEMPSVAAVGTIRAEERLLRRAIRNLLDNARRYGQGPVEITVGPAGNEVVIEVLDRGPGVPPDLAERIFEPFYRLPGHAESEGGVGLGLALVRQIAEHHGGRVQVQTRSGGGSCFTLRLPVKPEPTPARVDG